MGSDHSLIAVENVTRVYDLGETQVHALRGVSLTMDRGSFVAIMGASGSGKSTLMHILGCLDRPTSGRYLLEGRDVSVLTDNELSDARSQTIGFVFQSFNLLARTTALENIEMPRVYFRKNREGNAAARARSLLASVGIPDKEGSYPSQLSGGQQQRVAIARALINEPPILLADEPTGNLDTASSAEIMLILRKLNDDGKTVILVTHEPEIAGYAKRVIMMRDGKVISDK